MTADLAALLDALEKEAQEVADVIHEADGVVFLYADQMLALVEVAKAASQAHRPARNGCGSCEALFSLREQLSHEKEER